MPDEGEAGVLVLHGAATSSCSFRARIALNLLGLKYEYLVVAAAKRISEEYRKLNPQGLVPLLQHGSERICQSIAIMEYLQDVFGALSDKALLPEGPVDRARVRSLSLYICCDIQPLQNTRLDASLLQEGVNLLRFKQHWIGVGLAALERALNEPQSDTYCHGDQPTMADCCLIPQVWNAVHRYGLHLDDYPRVKAVYEACLSLPPVQAAMPEKQPDYTPPSD